jgi:hypothetical protein
MDLLKYQQSCQPSRSGSRSCAWGRPELACGATLLTVIPPTPLRPHRRPEGWPFAADESWRPLSFVLDDESLTESDQRLFAMFGQIPELELVHTAGDELPRLETKEEPPDEDVVTIHEVGPAGWQGTFGVHRASWVREQAHALASHAGVPAEEAWRALVMAEAADARESYDGFVTRRDYLLREQRDRTYSFEDAFALIGLALRLRRGRNLGPDLIPVGPTDFHFIVARDLTPSAWRWFSACNAHARATGDETISALAQTTIERLQRVLQIRDRLHAQAKVRRSSGTADELVFQFETLLLFLTAAFDTAARVAHLVHIDQKYWQANWRWREWRKKLPASLGDLADDGSTGAAVLTLISELRNTIHAQALQKVTLAGVGINDILPRLTSDQAVALRRRIVDLGHDPSSWGIVEQAATTYLRVDRYTESLLHEAIALLDALIAATATESLPGVVAADLMPPPDEREETHYFFKREVRSRARLLAGI